MMNSDRERIIKIIDNWKQLQAELEQNNISIDDIMNKRFIQWAVTTPLYNIGEHVYKISAEFKAKFTNIPWNKISGMRHRLVHNYEGTNWSIIVSVIKTDLPEFISELEQIVRNDK